MRWRPERGPASFRSGVGFLRLSHPGLVCVLFSAPSLLEMKFFQKLFPPSVLCFAYLMGLCHFLLLQYLSNPHPILVDVVIKYSCWSLTLVLLLFNTFFAETIESWNNLPFDVSTLSSLSSFKFLLKQEYPS